MSVHIRGSMVSAAIFLIACQSTVVPSSERDVGERVEASGQARMAPEESQRLVAALWKASNAEASGDRSNLLAALRTIEALGAQPLDRAAEKDLARWRSHLSEDELPMRGRILGPGFKSGKLAAGASLSLEQIFIGGESAKIALSSQEDQAVQIRITDFSDREVCAEAASKVTCHWLPLFTQRHKIDLVNPGERSVGYFLAIE